jgi:hypothetical protein
VVRESLENNFLYFVLDCPFREYKDNYRIRVDGFVPSFGTVSEEGRGSVSGSLVNDAKELDKKRCFILRATKMIPRRT